MRPLPPEQAAAMIASIASAQAVDLGTMEDLTPQELVVLNLLLASTRMISGPRLEMLLPGYGSRGSADVVKVAICRIRAKLGRLTILTGNTGYFINEAARRRIAAMRGEG